MKHIIIVLAALVQVVFASSVDCPKCSKKVQENIAFEKGVKDLSVDLDKHTITVVFNPSKTDTIKLRTAINKLGYSADVIEYKELKK
ncbi:MAG: cation transporter [Bacteroidales bacterium]|nr:cation transporter [Bacteroidales bacterium]